MSEGLSGNAEDRAMANENQGDLEYSPGVDVGCIHGDVQKMRGGYQNNLDRTDFTESEWINIVMRNAKIKAMMRLLARGYV